MGAVAPALDHPHHDGQARHGAVGNAGPFTHGRKPVLDLFGRDRVHGQIAEHGQDILAQDALIGFASPWLPAAGFSVEELLGEGRHRVSRCTGAVVDIRRFGEACDEPAGFAPGLRDRERCGVADFGVASPPVHGTIDGEGAPPAGRDAKHQSRDHVVADVVAFPPIHAKADAGGKGINDAWGVRAEPPKGVERT